MLAKVIWGLMVPIAFLSGCWDNNPSNITPTGSEPFYKRDMRIEVNGEVFDGVGVVKVQPRYTVTVDAKGTLNLLTITNCHRDTSKESAFEKGIFKDKSRARFSVSLFNEEEGVTACPFHIGGYDIKGKHSWGFLDFQNSAMELPAQIKCNGAKGNITGVAACQALTGTHQFMEFTGTVLQATSTTCPQWETKDNKKFSLTVNRGFCTYRFKETAKTGKEFRITVIGYDEILIREL